MLLAFAIAALAFAHKGDYGRAIEDYDQANQFNPKLSDAFCSRGNAYAHKGDYDRAIQDFDQALRTNPNLADAFYEPALGVWTQRRL